MRGDPATIGDLLSVGASLRIKCDCGREINWPTAMIRKAFAPGVMIEDAQARLRCRRCFARGRVSINVVVPARR